MKTYQVKVYDGRRLIDTVLVSANTVWAAEEKAWQQLLDRGDLELKSIPISEISEVMAVAHPKKKRTRNK